MLTAWAASLSVFSTVPNHAAGDALSLPRKARFSSTSGEAVRFRVNCKAAPRISDLPQQNISLLPTRLLAFPQSISLFLPRASFEIIPTGGRHCEDATLCFSQSILPTSGKGPDDTIPGGSCVHGFLSDGRIWPSTPGAFRTGQAIRSICRNVRRATDIDGGRKDRNSKG